MLRQIIGEEGRAERTYRAAEGERPMPEDQPELPLPAPPFPADLPLLPARILNEYVYCPRLAYLEWVQGEWADSADTEEGRFRHRRADKPSGALFDADDLGGDDRIHARSLTIASEVQRV